MKTDVQDIEIAIVENGFVIIVRKEATTQRFISTSLEDTCHIILSQFEDKTKE